MPNIHIDKCANGFALRQRQLRLGFAVPGKEVRDGTVAIDRMNDKTTTHVARTRRNEKLLMTIHRVMLRMRSIKHAGSAIVYIAEARMAGRAGMGVAGTLSTACASLNRSAVFGVEHF